jgi:probable F420-dependent oxidoreductase
MKFGFIMWGTAPADALVVARAAEAAGFDSVWLPEHLVLPPTLTGYPYTSSGAPEFTCDAPLYDPWVVLSAVAAQTSTIRLGTTVYILPLRHPIVTAKAVATLDIVSGGRVSLGIGVGWLREEFEALGENFENRGRRANEIIQILRRLWADDTITHQGDHYKFGPVKFEPKPVQKPSIPILVGGTSPRAIRRAATLCDGWMDIGTADHDHLGKMIAEVRAARREAGHQDDKFEITTNAMPDLENIRRLADLGVTSVLGAAGPGTELAAIAEWHDRVISKF